MNNLHQVLSIQDAFFLSPKISLAYELVLEGKTGKKKVSMHLCRSEHEASLQKSASVQQR